MYLCSTLLRRVLGAQPWFPGLWEDVFPMVLPPLLFCLKCRLWWWLGFFLGVKETESDLIPCLKELLPWAIPSLMWRNCDSVPAFESCTAVRLSTFSMGWHLLSVCDAGSRWGLLAALIYCLLFSGLHSPPHSYCSLGQRPVGTRWNIKGCACPHLTYNLEGKKTWLCDEEKGKSV